MKTTQCVTVLMFLVTPLRGLPDPLPRIGRSVICNGKSAWESYTSKGIAVNYARFYFIPNQFSLRLDVLFTI